MSDSGMPNIFNYATSELSQDAFICWLVEWGSMDTDTLFCNEHKELANCGRAFVEALFRAGEQEQGAVSVLDLNDELILYEGACRVGKVDKPKKQHNKIDVYFQAEIDGKRVTFVIEDKTDSVEHSDQLNRYLSKTKNNDEQKDYIKPVYFKTGYIYPHEKTEIRKNGYSIFDLEQSSNFLNAWVVCNHDIFQEYKEYVERSLKTRKTNINKLNFKEHYAQIHFMQKFHEKLKYKQDMWRNNIPKKFKYDAMQKINYEMGLGGNPWTNIFFAKNLFWRLDPCELPNRRLQMKLSNHVIEESYQDPLEVQFYVEAFDVAMKECCLEPSKFQTRSFRKGKPTNECIIGAVNIPDLGTESSMSLDEFLNRLVNLHVKFLEQVNKGWPPVKDA